MRLFICNGCEKILAAMFSNNIVIYHSNNIYSLFCFCFCLFCFFLAETVSERSASDPPEVIINQLKNRDLRKRATHLDVSRLPVDVLLLTVEDCEFLSCLSFLNPGFCSNFHRDLAYVYLGDMGKDERQ